MIKPVDTWAQGGRVPQSHTCNLDSWWFLGKDMAPSGSPTWMAAHLGVNGQHKLNLVGY